VRALRRSGAVHCLVDDAARLGGIRDQRATLPRLRHLVALTAPEASGEDLIGWEELRRRGRAVPPEVVRQRRAALRRDWPAKLALTPGTTGESRTVVLTHGNLAASLEALRRGLGLGEGPRSLAAAPLAHVAEEMLSVYLPLALGGSVALAAERDRRQQGLVAVRPTLVYGPPGSWDAVSAALAEEMRRLTGPSGRLLRAARRAHLQAHAAHAHGGPGPFQRLRRALADRWALADLRAAAGLDAAELLLAGGAALAPPTRDLLVSLGLGVRPCYALTETAGVAAASAAADGHDGGVGRPLPGLEARLAPDGEILLRGASVCAAYHADDTASRRALRDGWLYTGDLGAIDTRGRLRVDGRRQDLLATPSGRPVAPQALEQRLRGLPLVAQAMAVGGPGRALGALLALEPRATRRWAERNGRHRLGMEELVCDARLRAYMQTQLERLNRSSGDLAAVERFELLPRPLSAERGELTATLELRRHVVAERHRELIRRMYA
jgi:long-chain acyl-CoA synthetase